MLRTDTAAAWQHSEVLLDHWILAEATNKHLTGAALSTRPQCHLTAHGAANESQCAMFTVSKTNTELLQIILVGQFLQHTLSPVPIYPFRILYCIPPNPYDLHIKSCTMFGYQLVTYPPIPIYTSPHDIYPIFTFPARPMSPSLTALYTQSIFRLEPFISIQALN